MLSVCKYNNIILSGTSHKVHSIRLLLPRRRQEVQVVCLVLTYLLYYVQVSVLKVVISEANFFFLLFLSRVWCKHLDPVIIIIVIITIITTTAQTAHLAGISTNRRRPSRPKEASPARTRSRTVIAPGQTVCDRFLRVFLSSLFLSFFLFFQ